MWDEDKLIVLQTEVLVPLGHVPSMKDVTMHSTMQARCSAYLHLPCSLSYKVLFFKSLKYFLLCIINYTKEEIQKKREISLHTMSILNS